MASTLREILLAPGTQPRVVADCCTLIDREVSEQSGVSGAAVKVAYKTVNAFMPGHVRDMIESLLPQLVDKLEPYWAEFGATGGAVFGDYLAKHGEAVSQALLSVTDARAAASGRPTIIRAYRAVRGGAVKHVEIALPRVGDLVQRYAALSPDAHDAANPPALSMPPSSTPPAHPVHPAHPARLVTRPG